MAALPWNQWQLSRGMGGRLPLELVAVLVWNTQTARQRGSGCARQITYDNPILQKYLQTAILTFPIPRHGPWPKKPTIALPELLSVV